MKKFLLILFVVLGVAIYLDSERYGIGLAGALFQTDPDRYQVQTRTREFLSDLQFKNFDHAAVFHPKAEREKFDIPELIRKKFHVEPEHLDVRHFEVLRVDLAPRGDRAKAVVQVTVKVLNMAQVRDVEAVFYWHRVTPPEDGQSWFMDLRTSL